MISVIVPVYNSEDYLRPCLDSILSQTYSDFEVILVDDGSTDNCGRICDEYSENDDRISVIHQSNVGHSEARNAGLNVASGDYILFVDSDDQIHPAMIQTLYDALQSGDYDFSMVRGIRVPIKVPVHLIQRKYDNPMSLSRTVSRDDCVWSLFMGGPEQINYGVVWNKLYKKELIEGFLFRKTASEDTDFNNRVYQKVNRAITIDIEMYFWVQRPTSLTHSNHFWGNPDRLNSLFLCLNDIPRSETRYRTWCLGVLYKTVLSTKHNSRNTPFFSEACSLSDRIYNQTKSEFIHSDLDWKTKFGLLFFYHCPWSYSLFRTLMAMRKR